MTNKTLNPGEAFPTITVPTLEGGTTVLGTPTQPDNWKLVVVYRGAHCPLCSTYLEELNAALPELQELGIDVVAVSADTKELATGQLAKVNPNYPVGYDLSVEQMHQLGLYISGPQNGTNVQRAFAEPGVFVINSDGDLQIVDRSNVPFFRPPVARIVGGLRYLRGRTEPFPINGTFA